MTPEAATLHGKARRRLLEADAAWRPTPPELIARHLPYPCRWPCELGPAEAFSDEPGPADYFDLWPDHDPACMGAASEAVARRIALSCAGWPHRPTGQEFYDALRAERPTSRQRAIVGMWAVEASRLDMLDQRRRSTHRASDTGDVPRDAGSVRTRRVPALRSRRIGRGREQIDDLATGRIPGPIVVSSI